MSHSDLRKKTPEEKPDYRSSGAPQEIETKEKATLSQEEQKDTQTQLLNSADTKSKKLSPLAVGDLRSSPIAPQKNALAEMRFRNIVANSGVKQSVDEYYKEILNRADIPYGKWVAVGVIAILASLLAFMVGWLLGDPSRVKLGH